MKAKNAKSLPSVLLIALMAYFVVVATAPAEFQLLAEWLDFGSPITSSQASEMTSEMTFSDSKTIAGEAAIACSKITGLIEGVIFSGTIGANGSGSITEVLNLAREKIGVLGGLALLCSSQKACATATVASPIEVWPMHLPWATTLFLMENGEFLLKVEKMGVEMLCLILSLNVEDSCEASVTEFPVDNGSAGAAEIPALSTGTPLGACTASGGESSGGITFDQFTPIILTFGGLLTVSSE